MRKYTLVFIMLMCAIGMSAQVGVNTETPQATLDVKAKDGFIEAEGIIAPRLKLSDLEARDLLYGQQQSGALIYVFEIDVASSKDKTQKVTKPGYYYFYYSTVPPVQEWRPMSPNAGVWNKTGTHNVAEKNTDDSYLNAKAVISDSIKYIVPADVNGGTKNAQLTVVGGDAVINKVTVGAGKSKLGTALGVNALANDAGTFNTAIGENALSQLTEDSKSNTAIGASANRSVTKVSGSVAVGYGTKAEANNSVAIGYNSNASTPSNIAIGDGASAEGGNETWGATIALGHNAKATARRAVAIGEGAENNLPFSTYINQNTRIGEKKVDANSFLTLDVVGNPSNVELSDGFRAPSMSLEQLKAKKDDAGSLYRATQDGAVIYINDTTGIATEQAEFITERGYYYFDWYAESPNSVPATPQGRWVAIGNAKRRTLVKVYADGSGDYKELQKAYDFEAKKAYDQTKGNSVLFECKGDVGGLSADGAIPNIFLRGMDSATRTGDLILRKMSVFLEGSNTFSGKIEAYETEIIMLPNSTFQVDILTIDASTFRALDSNTINAELVNVYNGTLSLLNGTNLNISGGYSEDKYFGIQIWKRGYIEAEKDCRIKFDAIGRKYGVLVNDRGSFKCQNASLDFLRKNTESDIKATAGAYVSLENANINNSGGSYESTNSFIVADNLARISIIGGSINRTVDKAGFTATNKGLISFDGKSSVNLSATTNVDTYALYSVGGEISISGLKDEADKSKQSISNSGFKYSLYTCRGGIIKTLGMVSHGGGDIYPALPEGKKFLVGDDGTTVYDNPIIY